jgi:hypothetical protein
LQDVGIGDGCLANDDGGCQGRGSEEGWEEKLHRDYWKRDWGLEPFFILKIDISDRSSQVTAAPLLLFALEEVLFLLLLSPANPIRLTRDMFHPDPDLRKLSDGIISVARMMMLMMLMMPRGGGDQLEVACS